jgi:hypothetical protein
VVRVGRPRARRQIPCSTAASFANSLTALQVQRPRDLAQVERQVLLAAEILGREAFYAWGSGKNHTEGGTIHLANAMLAAYGNAAVAAEPVVETAEAWYFTHHFIDMETQISRPRQFMQSKREDVGMRTDPVRANQIRFNKGQSKAIRNCILQAMPRELVLAAIEVAKKSVSAKMDKFIKEKGLAAAQRYTLDQLARVGVPEDAVLRKTGREKTLELDANDLVALAGDYKAIDNGDANAEELFELRPKAAAGAADLKDKLRAATKPAESSGALPVRLGQEAYTWLVTDGNVERLVKAVGPELHCNCGLRQTPGRLCAHILAVEGFRKQA